jgi:hypothetical protein
MSADAKGDSPGLTVLASLRRFGRPRAVQERCELCNAGLPAEHAHLVEVSNRRLVCACDACAILFDRPPSPYPLPLRRRAASSPCIPAPREPRNRW